MGVAVAEQQWAADVAQAHEIQTRIKSAAEGSRAALWDLAQALYEWDEAQGWRRLQYDSLGEWLADPDITMTRQTYYRLVSTWRKLVVHRKVQPAKLRQLDQTKVAIVTSAISDGRATVEEGLADAAVLGARDLREKYLPPAPDDGKQESPNVETPDDTEDEDAQADREAREAEEQEEVDGELVTPVTPVTPVAGYTLSLDQLVAFAGKRWHRKPDTEAVVAHLQSLDVGAAQTTTVGADLATDLESAYPWEDARKAIAAGAANPRLPRSALEAMEKLGEKYVVGR